MPCWGKMIFPPLPRLFLPGFVGNVYKKSCVGGRGVLRVRGGVRTELPWQRSALSAFLEGYFLCVFCCGRTHDVQVMFDKVCTF